MDKTSDRLNFVQKLMSIGYERYISETEKAKGRFDVCFNPLNGWMGVTIYHPYERFTKDNKTIELSLEKFNVLQTTYKKEDGTWIWEKQMIKERSISISIDGIVVYANNYGVMPPQEIIERL